MVVFRIRNGLYDCPTRAWYPAILSESLQLSKRSSNMTGVVVILVKLRNNFLSSLMAMKLDSRNITSV